MIFNKKKHTSSSNAGAYFTYPSVKKSLFVKVDACNLNITHVVCM